MNDQIALIQTAARPDSRAGRLNHTCCDFLTFAPLSVLAAVQECVDDLRRTERPSGAGESHGNSISISVLEMYPFRVNQDKGEDRPCIGPMYNRPANSPPMCPVCDIARRCATAVNWQLMRVYPSHQDCSNLNWGRCIHQIWEGGHGQSVGRLITLGGQFLFLTAERNLSSLLPLLEGRPVPEDIYCCAASRLSQWLSGLLPTVLPPVETLFLGCLAGVEEGLFRLGSRTPDTLPAEKEFGLKIAMHIFGAVQRQLREVAVTSRPVWACWVGPTSLLAPDRE